MPLVNDDKVDGRLVFSVVTALLTAAWFSLPLFDYGAFFLAPILLVHNAVLALVGLALIVDRALKKRYAGHVYVFGTVVASGPFLLLIYAYMTG